MPGDISEALHLLVLSSQIRDRVAHQVGEGECFVHSGGGEVADDDGDLGGVLLRLQLGHHGWRQFDPIDTNASPAEWQRDTTGADAEFKYRARSGQTV